MKTQAIVSAVLFAAVSSLSAAAFAADAEKAPMKPHSHMEEKMGMTPPKAPAAASEEKKTDTPKAEKKSVDKSKDKTRHLHPRDGK